MYKELNNYENLENNKKQQHTRFATKRCQCIKSQPSTPPPLTTHPPFLRSLPLDNSNVKYKPSPLSSL